jgi:hypothetical protein
MLYILNIEPLRVPPFIGGTKQDRLVSRCFPIPKNKVGRSDHFRTRERFQMEKVEEAIEMWLNAKIHLTQIDRSTDAVYYLD